MMNGPHVAFLASTLRSFKDVTLVGEASNGPEAVKLIRTGTPGYGVSIFRCLNSTASESSRLLKKNRIPLIAFVTARSVCRSCLRIERRGLPPQTGRSGTCSRNARPRTGTIGAKGTPNRKYRTRGRQWSNTTKAFPVFRWNAFPSGAETKSSWSRFATSHPWWRTVNSCIFEPGKATGTPFRTGFETSRVVSLRVGSSGSGAASSSIWT